MLVTGKQIRAARALMGWEGIDLQQKAGLNLKSIYNYERGSADLKEDSIARLVKAFDDAGIEFTEAEGVRRKTQDVETFEGPERFDAFYAFMYDHLDRVGGDVCLSTVDERLFQKYRKNFQGHVKRMQQLVDSKRITMRVLATHSYFTSDYTQYKWQPEQSSSPVAFYAFGHCLALITFEHDPAPYVILIKSKSFSEAYRKSFELAWAAGTKPRKHSVKQ